MLKKETKQKKKKKTLQRNKKQRRWESNPVYLNVQATFDHCTTVTHMIWKVNFVISKQFFSAIDAV